MYKGLTVCLVLRMSRVAETNILDGRAIVVPTSLASVKRMNQANTAIVADVSNATFEMQ